MLCCWSADAKQRPTFSQLANDIDTVVTTMAGYLTMDFSCVEANATDSSLEDSVTDVVTPIMN